MTVRINAFIRDTIVENAIQGPLAAARLEEEQLREKRDSLKEELDGLAYDAAFSKKERELMASLPDGWLPKGAAVQVMIEEGGVRSIQFGESRPVPWSAHGDNYNSPNRVVGVLAKDCKYLKKEGEYKAAVAEHNAHFARLRDQQRGLKARVEAIVTSVTTVKRLVEIWPEVVDLLPEVVSDPVTTVPAIMIADLNAALGIPTKTKTE